MPEYEVYGLGRETGRKRRRVYNAPDEDSAINKASADGTVVERIERLPDPQPALATERQIAYADSLGLVYPPDITLAEMSHMIACKVEDDTRAPAWLKKYAAELELPVTEYVGQSRLYEWVQSHLEQEGRELELAKWFVRLVKREEDRQGYDDPSESGVDANVLDEIAGELAKDEQVIKSIRRYDGSDLIDPGENTDDHGTMTQGGSKRTIAYKRTAELLAERFRTRRPTTGNRAGRRQVAGGNAQGCATVLAVWLCGLMCAFAVVCAFLVSI